MRAINSRIIITSAVLLVILWAIIAYITFNEIFMPIKNYIKINHNFFEHAVSVFIFGTVVIIVLGALVLYYLYKFVGETKKSELRFRTIFDNTPVIHFIMDVETGNIIDANKAAEKFYGYTKEELASMSITDIALVEKEEHRQFRREVYNKGPENQTVRIFNHKLKNNEVKRVQLTISKIEIDAKGYLINSIIDITDKILYENSLKESTEFFKVLSENLVSGIVLYDYKYIYINPEGERILGYPREELYQKNVWDIYFGENVKQIIKSSIDRRLSGDIFNANYTLKIITKQNIEKWLLISSSTVKYKGKYTALSSFIDITELNNLKEQLEKERDALKIITDNMQIIIGLFREKIVYINPFALNVLGYTEKEILEMSPLDLVDTREEEKVYLSENIKKRLAGEYLNERYTLKVKKKNGEIFWGEILVTTIFFENKWTVLAIISDVNDRVGNELKLLKEKDVFKVLSEIDGLTQIPNRRSLDESLADSLSNALLNNVKFSLIMFDIDHFKKINDMYGHQTGDAVLLEIASLVKKNIRKEDFFARFGGEEFMIISNKIGLKGAVEFAEKLRFKIKTHSFTANINAGCSFGVAEYKHGDTAESIIKRVDAALYKAKENGRNRVENIK